MSRPRPRARRPKGPTRLVAFNKPMNVLTQFTDDGHWPGLGRFLDMPGLYPAGRLDRDSEGLVLLTNDGKLQARLSHPDHKFDKTYLVQVEGDPAEDQLQALRDGVTLNDGPTLPAEAERITPPDLWPRHPPCQGTEIRPGCLASTDDSRGAEPAGTSHDGPCGTALPAARALVRGALHRRGSGARRVERS